MIKCTILLIFIITIPANATMLNAGANAIHPPQAPNWKRAEYERLSDKYARQYKIPESIFRKLIKAESDWNRYAVSDKGAMGLTQVMPRTAKHFGVSPHKLFWPPTAIKTGARVLAQYIKECGGDLKAGLMAYNAGPSVCKYADSILQ